MGLTWASSLLVKLMLRQNEDPGVKPPWVFFKDWSVGCY